MRPCRHVAARLPFRATPGAMLLSVLGLLLVATAAHAQGPGLYKDGQRILDLEEMVSEDPGIAKTLAEPATPGRELYRRVLGDEAGTAQRPFDDYFRLAAACRQAVRYAEAQPDEMARAVSTLVDLEPALATAHAGVIDHLEAVRRNLAAEPRLEHKISRLEGLEREHLALAEDLLALLAALRDAEAGGHVFARDAALRDLALYFAADPIKAVEPEVDDGFRATSMPVVQPRESATPLTAGSLLSTYPVATAKSAMADPADLAPTIDVQITPEIMALADSLGRSPVAIYYFVRDQFEFEPYLGSRKGSLQTLQHRKGNDYDQASLLIALLRAAGIPARYAAGEAYMPMDRALNWLGFTSASGAASLLATAGMDPTWYPGGISCRRVWVEAYIPFANYRGAVNDSTGRMWIPLDPAFRQHDITWGHNLPADMGFDAETFVDDYMSTFRPETPIEHFVARLQSELPAHHPGATLADLVDRREVVREPDGILAGTLPYELLAFDGTFSEIPANLRYGIRFHVYGGGTNLDYTTTLPQIVLKQVTISYVGATPADQALIDAAGGVFGVTSPYLIDVVPVLKIDGCEVARGTGQVMMGTTHTSDMHFTAPTGAGNVMPTVTNVITAGNFQGIGIDTQDAFPATFETPSTSCPEELLGQELHQTALTYLNNVDTYEDLAAGYLHMTVLNDVSEAIVENAVTVYFSGSLPVSFTWTGMIVDADRKIIGPFPTDGRLNACQEMRLTGADGSFQENRVFETRFEEEAISAVKILSLAADSLITVCRITSSIAADCPGLSQPSSVVSAINAALAQGREVTIPERPFTYFDWSGTAWIAMDPATCAAGYIISGGQSGGATVQEWEIYYPRLACLYPAGSIEVSPAGVGPGNDIYVAESDDHLVFTVNDLRYISANSGPSPCAVIHVATRRFEVSNYTIKELAYSSRFGPGVYTFRVGGLGECGACSYREKNVTIVALETLKFKIGATPDWREFQGPQRVLRGKPTRLLAFDIEPPATSLPASIPSWRGTFGVVGAGAEVEHTYSGVAAVSDTDQKTVHTDCGPEIPENFVVCSFVLGVHSNVAPGSAFTGGHAWISITNFASASPVTTTFGLWPDEHPLTVDNGAGSDVRVNMEVPSGLYNRYYLLIPSEVASLNTYIGTVDAWSYFHTCANWAEGAVHAAVGENVDANDYLGFGTPREISRSIRDLEAANPTNVDKPRDGGEDAGSSSTGSSWGGSSFL